MVSEPIAADVVEPVVVPDVVLALDALVSSEVRAAFSAAASREVDWVAVSVVDIEKLPFRR